MPKRKIGSRYYVTFTQGDKIPPSNRFFGEANPIYTLHQHFQMRRKHLKGSNRPAGWFTGYPHGSVEFRWIWTETHNFFAPEITFRPRAVKLATKIAKALKELEWGKESPDALCLTLKACEVEYISDNKEGCWDDYRLLRDYTENAMMTLARATQ